MHVLNRILRAGARLPAAFVTALRAACQAMSIGVLLSCLWAEAAVPSRVPEDPYLIQFERSPSALQMAAIGKMLFFDAQMSGSSRVSCASCHDPEQAFGPPNGLAVQSAGRYGTDAGVRAVPSLRYREAMPAFTEHFHEGEDVNGDQGPTGGLTWDGRAATAHDQARLPLFSSYEMANKNDASLAARIRSSRAAGAMREAFGAHALDDDGHAVGAAILCLEVFQQDPKSFYPFSSKYDAYLRGKAQLSIQETRGMELFENPAKGNCALCHPNSALEGAFPMFTDNGYIAVGMPRNRDIPANHDRHYFDLGLCGPYRDDLRARADYCGMFRTPSLRNVAIRQAFFHNGEIHDLTQAVAFYASRDTHPERWYPGGHKFDDLPPRFQVNVNQDAPFGGHLGAPDALSPAEIEDIVAFLKTLTDADLSAHLAHGVVAARSPEASAGR